MVHIINRKKIKAMETKYYIRVANCFQQIKASESTNSLRLAIHIGWAIARGELKTENNYCVEVEVYASDTIRTSKRFWEQFDITIDRPVYYKNIKWRNMQKKSGERKFRWVVWDGKDIASRSIWATEIAAENYADHIYMHEKRKMCIQKEPID